MKFPKITGHHGQPPAPHPSARDPEQLDLSIKSGKSQRDAKECLMTPIAFLAAECRT
jgi:hypothetical protein